MRRGGRGPAARARLAPGARRSTPARGPPRAAAPQSSRGARAAAARAPGTARACRRTPPRHSRARPAAAGAARAQRAARASPAPSAAPAPRSARLSERGRLEPVTGVWRGAPLCSRRQQCSAQHSVPQWIADSRCAEVMRRAAQAGMWKKAGQSIGVGASGGLCSATTGKKGA